MEIGSVRLDVPCMIMVVEDSSGTDYTTLVTAAKPTLKEAADTRLALSHPSCVCL